MIKRIIFGLFAGMIACTSTTRKENSSDTITEAKARKVEIRKTGDRFYLYRDGQPYYVKGAAGHTQLEMLRAAGGNSIRTYTTDGLDTLLDQAHRLGLSVAVGIYLGREREGFDYDDPAAVRGQRARVTAMVNRYKNHPAVLCWILGNELDNESTGLTRLWREVNELALTVKQIDPGHPVTTTIYYWAPTIKLLMKEAPALDFISINAFGGLWQVSASLHREVPEYDRPYLLTEWGFPGPWEVSGTGWQAPIEPALDQKGAKLRSNWQDFIIPDSARCLGSYVFYWGNKQEGTATWYSFFTEQEEKTALVDVMNELWGGAPTPNHAPLAGALQTDAPYGNYLQAGKTYTAIVPASDPDGDPLYYRWEIIPEMPVVDPKDITRETKPDSIPRLIQRQTGNRVWFQPPPKTGPYRLTAWVYDGRGGVGYASAPFFVIDHRLVE